MRKTKPTAEEIAEMADRGENITPYLSKPKKGYAEKLKQKHIQRTTIDFGIDMIKELDFIASKLNISRQAVVKMVLQDYLNRYHLAQNSKLLTENQRT